MIYNNSQKKAVMHTTGPMMVLAGPGSGKTAVITGRTCQLVTSGISASRILVVTFTRAAAKEMKERYLKAMGKTSTQVTFGTFHGVFYAILRHTYRMSGNNILSEEEKKRLMRELVNHYARDLEEEDLEENLAREISTVKNNQIPLEHYYSACMPQEKFREIYEAYEKWRKENKKLDFDDLMVQCKRLFLERPEVLRAWQQKFQYILIDEFQDISPVQYEIVRMLALPENNLFIVGDDDQSIYRFRGANIKNILRFEEAFPGAKVIKLEQNYRSTKTILSAANEVIRNNEGRKDKTLWTENETGEKIRVKLFDTAYDEAEGIVSDIMKRGGSWKDSAILYRTNAQSRILEEKFVTHNIPYRMVGGVNFYQRKEIKDILAYLKTIANGRDDLAVQRIINVPKRGIGAVSIGKVNMYAAEHGMNFYDALLRIGAVPGLGKAAPKIDQFTDEIGRFRKNLKDGMAIQNVITDILESTGYKAELMEEGEVEAETRLENISELSNKAVAYWEDAEEPTLDGFLEEVALVADIDSMDESEDRVVLMTLHSAKGLEFPYVYMSGLEDGLFPSSMAMSEDPEALEEERRLCYVGITRAEKTLMMTVARQRMVKGETRFSRPSRFLAEIPEEYKEEERQEDSVYQRSRKLSSDDLEDPGLPWARSSGISMFGQNPYVSKKSGMPSAQPAFGKAFTVQKAASLDYAEGDRVHHVKFGDGTVKQIADGGKDYEVTVEFDSMGVRKMFASFARLQKL